MSLPLQGCNSLFWRYRGQIMSSWYLCGDGMTDDHRLAHVAWCKKYKCDTVILCLNNEDCMSLFRNGYMKEVDAAKWQTFRDYVDYINREGGKVALAIFDGPEIPGGKYHPILNQTPLHPLFIAAMCGALGTRVKAILIGCETNRYASILQVEEAIGLILSLLPNMPVGTHEQSVRRDGKDKYSMTRRIPANAKFYGYETSNHPAAGNNVSVSDMASEVRFLVSQLPPGMGAWIIEHNTEADGEISMAQARAMAELPGVVGIGGPM